MCAGGAIQGAEQVRLKGAGRGVWPKADTAKARQRQRLPSAVPPLRPGTLPGRATNSSERPSAGKGRADGAPWRRVKTTGFSRRTEPGLEPRSPEGRACQAAP